MARNPAAKSKAHAKSPVAQRRKRISDQPLISGGPSNSQGIVLRRSARKVVAAVSRPDVQEEPAEPALKEKPATQRKPALQKKPTSQKNNPTTTAQWRPVSNPQATFLGLPAELRLEIYSHLSETSMIHVHYPKPGKFTWTPCKATNPKYPLLCLNPKWSGLCRESERCTFKHASPAKLLGFWGLAATCHFIRNEAKEFFTRETVHSVHPLKLRKWLQWLEKRAPKKLEQVTKINLAGADDMSHWPKTVLKDLQTKVPNLQAVGFQCQTPRWRWLPSKDRKKDVALGSCWKSEGSVMGEVLKLDARITVVIEGMVWTDGDQMKGTEDGKTFRVKQEQGVVRMLSEGKEVGAGARGKDWKKNRGLQWDVVPMQKPVVGKWDAEWKEWWRAEELVSFADAWHE